jgi:hypothetical protein
MPPVSAWTVAISVGAAALLTTVVDAKLKVPPATASEKSAGSEEGAGLSPDFLTFVDTTFPAASTGTDGKINVLVFVRSSAKQQPHVSPTVVLRSVSGENITPIGVTLKEPLPKSSKSTDVFGLPLTITLPKVGLAAFPLSGWLIIEPIPAAPTSTPSAATPQAATGPPAPPADRAGVDRPDKITPAKLEIRAISGPGTGAEWRLLKYALIAAGAGVLIATLVLIWLLKFSVLWHRMGKSRWDFQNSWSSTLTIAGTIVGLVVSAAALPDQGATLSKKTYTIVGIILAALITLAPGVYNLFRKAVQAKSADATAEIQFQGIVTFFLAAALLTVTGSLAQLGLLGFLFHDIAAAGSLSPATAIFLQRLCTVLQVLIWIYSVTSIVQTVRTQSSSAPEAEGTQPVRMVRAGVQLDPATAADVKHQLPDWPLL